MKRPALLLLCLLLLAGCAAPTVYSGPTKSAWVLTEQVSTYFSDTYGIGEAQRTVFAYDTFGNRAQVLNYQDGELSSERRYTYDDRGNVIAAENWEHGGLFSYPTSRTGYTYDEQNRPLATIYRNFLGFEKSRDTYTYDAEANTVFWNGAYDTKTTWLDENGRTLRTLVNSKGSGIEMENRYEYDELGRNIRIVSSWDGELFSTLVLSYDDQDRLTVETTFDDQGTVIRRRTFHYTENTVTTYELDGEKTTEIFRPDGQVEKMEQFDKQGNLTMLTLYTYQEIQVPTDWEE